MDAGMHVTVSAFVSVPTHGINVVAEANWRFGNVRKLSGWSQTHPVSTWYFILATLVQDQVVKSHVV